jgi:hypothetical protein
MKQISYQTSTWYFHTVYCSIKLWHSDETPSKSLVALQHVTSLIDTISMKGLEAKHAAIQEHWQFINFIRTVSLIQSVRHLPRKQHLVGVSHMPTQLVLTSKGSRLLILNN